MLALALQYARRGWPVFPCDPDSKRPFVKHGFKEASTAESMITQWWKRWPLAMIGVPTGAPVGAFVVDLDPKEDKDADTLLRDLVQAIDAAPPPCPITKTPRGGYHLWFAMPADGQDIGNRGNLLHAGIGEPKEVREKMAKIDVRGTGGYVIVAGSQRRGKQSEAEGCHLKSYVWLEDSSIDDMDPPPPPPALVRLITRPPEREAAPRQPLPARPTDQNYGDASRATKYAVRVLHDETTLVANAGKGERNNTLNQAAIRCGMLVPHRLLTIEEITLSLVHACKANGLWAEDGERGVMATIRSGLAYGQRNPRRLPDMSRATGRPNPPPPSHGDLDHGSHGRGGEEGEASTAGGGGGGFDGGEPPDTGGEDDRDRDLDPEILAALSDEPQTDVANGRRLRTWYGADLLTVAEVGVHVWDGKLWNRQGGERLMRQRAHRTAERIVQETRFIQASPDDKEIIDAAERAGLFGKEWSKMDDAEKRRFEEATEAKERLKKKRDSRYRFAMSSANSARITAMMTEAAPYITVEPGDMDREVFAINVQNGTLRVGKVDQESVDPDYDGDEQRMRVTRVAAVRLDDHSRLDRISRIASVSYDPSATAPRWLAFVERFQPDPGRRRFLQQWHGYGLTAATGEQFFVFNYGKGRNGKSTFMEAISRLMGSYASILPAETLTGDQQRRGDQATPELARLPGIRMVRCAELKPRESFREDMIKKLTGGEVITVRHLHEGFFDFSPVFKVIGSGNDKPNISGVDEGIWRRMLLVEWPVAITDAEVRPMEKVLGEFAEEGPGILNWLLDGLKDYLDNGLVIPPDIRTMTDAYRADMDPVGQFLEACVTQASGKEVTARDLYKGYVAWCHANSVKPFAERGFASVMDQKGFRKSKGRIRQYQDIVLHSVPTDPDLEESRPY